VQRLRLADVAVGRCRGDWSGRLGSLDERVMHAA
jgi:hypothetical protein